MSRTYAVRQALLIKFARQNVLLPKKASSLSAAAVVIAFLPRAYGKHTKDFGALKEWIILMHYFWTDDMRRHNQHL
jgi:hypothetical protein